MPGVDPPVRERDHRLDNHSNAEGEGQSGEMEVDG